jgi:hypothetical protein
MESSMTSRGGDQSQAVMLLSPAESMSRDISADWHRAYFVDAYLHFLIASHYSTTSRFLTFAFSMSIITDILRDQGGYIAR